MSSNVGYEWEMLQQKVTFCWKWILFYCDLIDIYGSHFHYIITFSINELFSRFLWIVRVVMESIKVGQQLVLV